MKGDFNKRLVAGMVNNDIEDIDQAVTFMRLGGCDYNAIRARFSAARAFAQVLCLEKQ